MSAYQLNDFDTEARPPQSISFYEKNEDGTIEGGTTLEELLKVSILNVA